LRGFFIIEPPAEGFQPLCGDALAGRLKPRQCGPDHRQKGEPAMGSYRSARAALACAFVMLAPAAALALSDVTLDNIQIKDEDATVAIPHVLFAQTNITKDEAAKLFSKDAPETDRKAIVAKMQAAKISIPAMQFTAKDGSGSAHDFVVTGVNAGRFKRIDFAGGEASFKVVDPNDGKVTLRQLTVEDGDFSRVLAALSEGQPASMAGSRLSKLTWAGFDATFPDKETSKSAPGGNLIHVSLASASGQGTYEGDTPVKGSFELKNLVVELAKGSSAGKQLAAFGYDKLDLGLTAGGAYDAAKKTYQLDDFTISAAGAGSLGLTGTFTNVDRSSFDKTGPERLAELMKGEIASLGLKFVNSGLAENAIAFYAKTQHKNAEQVKRELAGMVVGMAPMMLGNDPAIAKVANAVSAFIANPKSLSIALTAKGEPVKVGELMAIRDPHAFLARVSVDAVANR
jgi:hypothetical protein